jgi:hypothetical protein
MNIDAEEQSEIAFEKERHQKNIATIKHRHRFKRADIKGKADILKKLSSEGSKDSMRILNAYWGSLDQITKLEIIRTLFAKAVVMKVWIGEYNGVSLSSFKLTPKMYQIELWPMKGINFRLVDQLSREPSEDEVLKIINQFLPRVMKVEISTNIRK